MKLNQLLVVIIVGFAIITCKADSSFGVQPPDLEVIALTGDQVPGMAPGVEFGGFQSAFTFSSFVINEEGQTAFQGTLANIFPNAYIFSEGSGTLELVRPSFNPLTLRLNSAGQIVVSSGGRIFSKRPGEAEETVASSGDQVPNADADVVFRNLRELGLSDTGKITFTAGLSSQNGGIFRLGSGLFSHEAGVLTSIVQSDDPAPFEGLFNPQFQDIAGHALNASGQTVFEASGSGNAGIFRQGPREITPVTTLDNDFRIGGFLGGPVINAFGETAFLAAVNNDSSAGFRGGVFSTASGALRRVAIEGDQAPGVEPGVVFEDLGLASPFGSNPGVALNDAGQTSFYATLAGDGLDFTNDVAIFIERENELELIVRVGDQVPNAEAGLQFGRFGSDESPNTTLNGAGQIAFVALLTTDFVNVSAVGIFATDLNGQLIEIVRTGDLIDVNDDPLVEDLRAVQSLQFEDQEGDIDRVSAKRFNDSGQLVFTARFEDGSDGLFVSNRAVLETVLGDASLNGVVDFLDIGPFISILSTGGFLDQADINQDGQVNFMDISPFIDLLSLN